jgi:hypothetical protein
MMITNLNKKMIIMKWMKKNNKKLNIMKMLRNIMMSKMNMSKLMIKKSSMKEFNQ